jgi:DNA repair photolyase
MKFFFVAEDSLYKIFKTLEKIPKWKSIEISIDSQHSLFDNERWWKQIKEILDKKSIKATFVTKTETTRRFFEKIWLKTKHIEKNKFMKYLRIIYLFFFDIKKFI